MKIRCITFVVAILVSAALLTSCGKSGSPVQPATGDISAPDSQITSTGNRQVFAVYDAVIDRESGSFTISPAERDAAFHFPLTSVFPHVLAVTGYGFTPNFWADIRLSHPYPGSGINGYDPRVIAIVPANASHYFNFPLSNVIGNGDIILEPDGYTKLFDNLGGSITGNTNPFKAYFKDQPFRIWSSTGVTQETQRWNMNIDAFGGALRFKLVVDVSTNYPAPPQPIVDNAPEPVKLRTSIGYLTDVPASTAQAYVFVTDWQGMNGLNWVTIESPGLFSDLSYLDYLASGPNPDEYIYSGVVYNLLGAPAGIYSALVAAFDNPSGLTMYDIAEIHVESAPTNMVNVTPKSLNSAPVNVFYKNGYVWSASDVNGLHVFDVTDYANPHWLNSFDMAGSAQGVFITSTYGYVASGNGGLNIFKMYLSLPTADLIYTVDTPSYAQDVDYYSGYAYVADGYSGLQIIDVDPATSASIVKAVQTSGFADAISYNVGYAYLACGTGGVDIIDASPINTAYKVNNIPLPDARDIVVYGGTAYVADGSDGLLIINVLDPLNPQIINTIPMSDAHGISTSTGSFAYVADGAFGVKICDVSPAESAFIIKTVDLPGHCTGIKVAGNQLYVANESVGLQVIDMNPMENSFLAGEVNTAGNVMDVKVSDQYACLANGYGGLAVMDISTPESTFLTAEVDTPDFSWGLDLLPPYAFVADETAGLQVIEYIPPQDAGIYKSINTIFDASDVFVNNGYAYVSNRVGSLVIVDIDPLNFSQVVGLFSDIQDTQDIDFENGYAYALGAGGNLYIIDINQPDTANVVKIVSTSQYANDLAVRDSYAYVSSSSDGVHIIDVYPPESAFVCNIVFSPPVSPKGVVVDGGFLYVSDYDGTVLAFDISFPEDTRYYSQVDTGANPGKMFIQDNYLYCAAYRGGLRIIKLW